MITKYSYIINYFVLVMYMILTVTAQTENITDNSTLTATTSETTTTTLPEGAISLEDALSDIETDINTLNEKLEKLKKFRDYTEDIEAELDLLKRKTYIQSMNRSDLESLAIGYLITLEEKDSEMEQLSSQCKINTANIEKQMKLEVEDIRNEKENFETYFACSLILICVVLIYYNRSKVFGRDKMNPRKR